MHHGPPVAPPAPHCEADRGTTGRRFSTEERLEAWRASGADGLLPVRFRFIESMHERTRAHSGAIRTLLDARLHDLLDDFDSRVRARASREPACPVGDAKLNTDARSEEGLSQLVGRLTESGRETCDDHLDPGRRKEHSIPPGELKSAQVFRRTWVRMLAERRVAEVFAQIPANAGPLNSHRLIHRSLELMREVSPEYFEQFVGYVDGLAWLETLVSPAAAAPLNRAGTQGARRSRRSDGGEQMGIRRPTGPAQ